MRVGQEHYRTIWLKQDQPEVVQIIDQRFLPHEFRIESLSTVDNVALAIKDMHVRGAGLIGATAAYGMYLATVESQHCDNPLRYLKEAAEKLLATRPTAVNLSWAIQKMMQKVSDISSYEERIQEALTTASEIADQDAHNCKMIGFHGVQLLEEIARRKEGPINILTHCNAGWLAFVDYGSATSPIYAAHDKDIQVHVWVDETRPRNQGARLTAWELGQHGVPHTVITDNAGGHLMQHGYVDLVIVGTDRTTRSGDVANKIGTYLKALAAFDNEIPFYVALPSSSIDWSISDGIKEIPIEERGEDEIKYIQGLDGQTIKKVLLTPKASQAKNYGFDVTPARLITGLITERGICPANESGLLGLFPEFKKKSI